MGRDKLTDITKFCSLKMQNVNCQLYSVLRKNVAYANTTEKPALRNSRQFPKQVLSNLAVMEHY